VIWSHVEISQNSREVQKPLYHTIAFAMSPRGWATVIFPTNKQKKNDVVKRQNQPRPREPRMSVTHGAYLAIPKSTFPPPFPDHMKCSLGYTQTINLASSATANTYGTQVTVNLNSLFLPVSSGSHQPYYLDQLAVVYNRYRVHAVKVRVVAFSADPTATDVLMCSTLLTSPGVNGTLTGTVNDIATEKPRQVTGIVQPLGSIATSQFNLSATIAELCGLSELEMLANTSDYSALVSASPSRLAQLMIASANDSNAVSKTVRIHLFIDYESEFFEPLLPAQS
jgi:hypothetical protein